jgi:hypothetical protein
VPRNCGAPSTLRAAICTRRARTSLFRACGATRRRVPLPPFRRVLRAEVAEEEEEEEEEEEGEEEEGGGEEEEEEEEQEAAAAATVSAAVTRTTQAQVVMKRDME